MNALATAEAVVIPAYNEVRTIRDVAQRALAQSPLVIVVDDGCTDGTASALEGLPVVVLRNEVNRGKAASLRRGVDEAIKRGAAAVITLDGDGQHCPEDIPLLMAAYAAAPGQIIIGSRLHKREEIPLARYRANRFANFWISWAAGYAISDSQSGFRVYPLAVFSKAKVNYDEAHSFVFESEILIEAARLGVYAKCVPISVIYSVRTRPSHFRPVVDIARIVRMVAWRLLARGLYLQGLARSLKLT
ncbi:MAG: glycosyltransferase family 2 protein [Betaproteobacteria bacterium]|nr:glycosyltransferase family 2 protein [Betaproteobacteria bacterium]